MNDYDDSTLFTELIELEFEYSELEYELLEFFKWLNWHKQFVSLFFYILVAFVFVLLLNQVVDLYAS